MTRSEEQLRVVKSHELVEVAEADEGWHFRVQRTT